MSRVARLRSRMNVHGGEFRRRFRHGELLHGFADAPVGLGGHPCCVEGFDASSNRPQGCQDGQGLAEFGAFVAGFEIYEEFP